MLVFITIPSNASLISIRDNAIVMTGDINGGDADIVIAILSSHSDIKKIILTSQGGDFEEGVQLGIYIFNNDISVDARDICGSTCAYIWLASPHKIASVTAKPIMDAMGRPYPLILIHMPFASDTKKSNFSSVAEAAWYMGVIRLSNIAVSDIVSVQYPELYPIFPSTTTNWNIGKIEILDLTPKTFVLNGPNNKK
jgi:hypothetical protein